VIRQEYSLNCGIFRYRSWTTEEGDSDNETEGKSEIIMGFATNRKWLIRSLAAWLLAGATVLAQAADGDWGLNMTQGVTSFSHEVYRLHMLIFGICVGIGVLVFGVMIYSMIKHRKSQGAVAAQFHHSTRVEIIWTIIPFLILVGMAVPATRTLILMEKTGDAAMTVKVTGYQWMWKYDYLDEGIGFYSRLARDSDFARRPGSGTNPRSVDHYLLEVDHRLVLPTHTKIRFLLTAGDVIHAWWVPVLGWKRDAIPGFVNQAWSVIDQEGVYRGQCAELCGKDHGFMPIVVEAVSPEKYQAWVAARVAEQQPPSATSTRLAATAPQ